jgi:hypothetical protein
LYKLKVITLPFCIRFHPQIAKAIIIVILSDDFLFTSTPRKSYLSLYTVSYVL